jgi:hypothetical protein
MAGGGQTLSGNTITHEPTTNLTGEGLTPSG